MDKIALIITFAAILGCQRPNDGIKATIYYAPGLASNTIAVPCDLFERLDTDSTKGRFDIDTRRKIIFHQGASIHEVCMGYVGDIEVDGQALKEDTDLFKLMNDLVEPELSN